MASKISTLALRNNVKKFILESPNDTSLDHLAEQAIIMADRDLRVVDSLSPLAWDIVPYDGLRTKTYATISAITQASPGVITADSVDSDVDGHGFDNHSTITDIVVIDNIEGMKELNDRMFLLQYIDEDTFSLKTLDGLSAVNTTNYTEYDSGGVVYHAGYVLNDDTILTDVDSKWTIKRLLPHLKLDGFPLNPVTEQEVEKNRLYNISLASRPTQYRYWQHMTTTSTVYHYVFFYPVCSQAYNLSLKYQKEVPDISSFTSNVYPFHPPQVHDAIWHGALAKLVGNSKRVQRQNDRVIATKMEIMWAQRWQLEWEKGKVKTIELSRQLLGDLGDSSGISA